MATYRITPEEYTSWQQPIIALQNSPPGSPTEGDRYIVGSSPTGDWSGNAGKVATYTGAAWIYATPTEGFYVWDLTENNFRYFDGTAWRLDPVYELAIIYDYGDTVIPTGEIKHTWHIPFDATIVGWFFYCDPSGSITIDLWKDTYANHPATDADSITASAPPAISSSTKNTDTTLTGWTKTIDAGQHIKVNVDSCTSVKRFDFFLLLKRRV